MTTSQPPGGMGGYLMPSFTNTGKHTQKKFNCILCLVVFTYLDWLVSSLSYCSRPDLVDMSRVSTQTNRSNLEQAFGVAEQLGVARLLDPEGETHI